MADGDSTEGNEGEQPPQLTLRLRVETAEIVVCATLRDSHLSMQLSGTYSRAFHPTRFRVTVRAAVEKLAAMGNDARAVVLRGLEDLVAGRTTWQVEARQAASDLVEGFWKVLGRAEVGTLLALATLLLGLVTELGLLENPSPDINVEVNYYELRLDPGLDSGRTAGLGMGGP